MFFNILENKNEDESDDKDEDDLGGSEDNEGDSELEDLHEFDNGDLEDLDDLDLDDLDDDLSDIEFSDDSNNEEIEGTSKKRKKDTNITQNKKHKGVSDKTFVSAEEFAEMLESQGQSKFKYEASRSFSNKDRASAKQLDWETARNQRISDFRGRKKGKNFNNFKSKKKFPKLQKPMKRKTK